MCVFVHGLDYQGRVFFRAVPPCRSFLVCQHVKEHRQPFVDDAKLDTKFDRQMAFKMAVSDILRLSLEFSVFP